MCVIHSRFSEVRRYYKDHGNVEDLAAIPFDHAHPNIDNENKIAIFHNGFISNFLELKTEIKSRQGKLHCGSDITKMTDSQLITSLVAEQFHSGVSLKDALADVVGKKLMGTYIVAAMELANPKNLIFIKNSGDFSLCLSKAGDEVILSSELSLFKDNAIKQKFNHGVPIPNNHIVEVK